MREKRSFSLDFSKSLRYQTRYPDLAFGFTLISGCKNHFNPPNFDQHKRKLLRKLRKRENLEKISENIGMYNRFFEEFGYACPLPDHLTRTVNSGFPRYNLMVDTHFISEMYAGILVAVTDYDMFEGTLTLDLASKDETCTGMGHREFYTKDGEILLRDSKEIVCVLCQGADEKTRVTEHTENVLFYAYAVPGINEEYLREGLSIAAETMAEFGGGNIEILRIY